MESTRRCLFCGCVDGKRSKEHVLRRSFGKVFPKASELSFSAEAAGSLALHKQPMSQFDLVLNAVCRDCNQGWLEALENEASEMVSQMIFASGHGAFQPEKLQRLGFWFYVRALLRTHVSPQGRAPIQLFGDAFRSQIVPDACSVQVGLCDSYICEAGSHQAVLVGPSKSYVAHVGVGLGPLLFLASIHDGQPDGVAPARQIAMGPRTWFPDKFIGLHPLSYPQQQMKTLTEQEGMSTAFCQAIFMGLRPPIDHLGRPIEFEQAIPPQFHASLNRQRNDLTVYRRRHFGRMRAQ
jgi:hypothetical protein